jgi:hypothetical protein
MALFPTLRRVLANLQEGRAAEAVRTGEPVAADAAFRHRMQAQAATDAWLQTLLPAVPVHLHAALQQCTAVHGDAPPVTSLPGLLAELAGRRDNLLAVLDRGGQQPTAAEQALLDDLAELLAWLPGLTEPGGAHGIAPATR